MIRDYFHRWEQELAAVSQADRLVRPFDWGVDWIEDIASLIADPRFEGAAT